MNQRMKKLIGLRKIAVEKADLNKIWQEHQGKAGEILDDMLSSDLTWGGGGEFADVKDYHGKIKEFAINQIFNGTLTLDNFYENIEFYFEKVGETPPEKKSGNTIDSNVNTYFLKLEQVQDSWSAMPRTFKITNDTGKKATISYAADNGMIRQKFLDLNPNTFADLSLLYSFVVSIEGIDKTIFYEGKKYGPNTEFKLSTDFGRILAAEGGTTSSPKAKTEKATGGGKARTTPSSGSTGPQATTGEILIDEAHRGLTGLVDGNDPRFVYTTAPDGSWADYTVDGKTGARRLDKTFKNWPEVVRQMNTFEIKGATKTPAAPAATTAPATGGAAAEAPKAEKSVERPDLNPMAVANVQAIIYRASTKALAFWTRQDEMGRIKDMIMAIKDQLPEIRGSDNSALDYLAKIVYSRNKTVLDPFVGNEDISAAIYRAEPKDLKVAKKGQYSQAVSEVLKAVNRIYDEQRRTPNYFKSLKEEPKAAQKEDKADDGSSFGKKSSLDSRINKLAKLRRLRVRAQMEAAIEPSAKFGRSRVS